MCGQLAINLGPLDTKVDDGPEWLAKVNFLGASLLEALRQSKTANHIVGDSSLFRSRNFQLYRWLLEQTHGSSQHSPAKYTADQPDSGSSGLIALLHAEVMAGSLTTDDALARLMVEQTKNPVLQLSAGPPGLNGTHRKNDA